jgi:hypothetical protein
MKNNRANDPINIDATYPRAAVQWLIHPDSYRDCASIKVSA